MNRFDDPKSSIDIIFDSIIDKKGQIGLQTLYFAFYKNK